MNLFEMHITEIMILLFLFITFVISSFEKITDWKGSINFIENHFINSPLKNFVPFLLAILLIIEIFGSGFILGGIFELIFYGEKKLAFIGISICAISLIFMLIGQRLAKDYVGAMSLTVYFILTVFGMFLLNR